MTGKWGRGHPVHVWFLNVENIVNAVHRIEVVQIVQPYSAWATYNPVYEH